MSFFKSCIFLPLSPWGFELVGCDHWGQLPCLLSVILYPLIKRSFGISESGVDLSKVIWVSECRVLTWIKVLNIQSSGHWIWEAFGWGPTVGESAPRTPQTMCIQGSYVQLRDVMVTFSFKTEKHKCYCVFLQLWKKSVEYQTAQWLCTPYTCRLLRLIQNSHSTGMLLLQTVPVVGDHLWCGQYEVPGPALQSAFDGITPPSNLRNWISFRIRQWQETSTALRYVPGLT